MRRQKIIQREAIFLSSLLIVVFLAGLNLPASGEGQLNDKCVKKLNIVLGRVGVDFQDSI